MKFRFLATIVFAAAAKASALLARSPTPSSLQARYVNPSEFPTQCQSPCLPIIDALNTCTSKTCICTNTNGQYVETCGDCVLTVNPTPTEQAQVQYVLDYYTDYCFAAGIPVTPLSISVSGIVLTPSSSAAAAGGGAATAAATKAATTSTTNPLGKLGGAGRMGMDMTLVLLAGGVGLLLAAEFM